MASALTPDIEQDSEDDFDWEEVPVPDHQQEEEPQQQHLEITIPGAGPRSKKSTTPSKFKGIPHEERLRRIDCHKLHTVVLLANAWYRNKWLNDPLLQARLLSLTPLSLQNAFGMIHKSRVADQGLRGRMFEAAIVNLVEWWSQTHFEVIPSGHLKNRTFDDVQARLEKLGPPPTDPDAVLDIEDVEDIMGEEPERIRSEKSLMKHALMGSGSRDVSAQLFTALCRGLGIPARLVASIQSVPWQTHVGKPKPTYVRKPKGDKGKGKAKASDNEYEETEGTGDSKSLASTSGSRSGTPVSDGVFLGEGQRLDGAPVPKSDKAKGKEKAQPVINLRKGRSKGHRLGSGPGSSSAGSSKIAAPDPRTTPPVFWTEVFSRPDGRWIPVDPIRSLVNKRKVFDPTPTSAAPAVTHSPLFPQAYAEALDRRAIIKNASRAAQQENRMVYVLAFEEDGFARDVTRRYAKEYSAKVAKVQGGSNTIGGGGKARQAWWEAVMSIVSRPYRLNRDDIEDEELDAAQMTEGMPSTISGFKDHPIYALARHLKQNQVIHPPDTPEIGKFRGEGVYPRSAVVSLKTAENWMRSEGRMVREGSQPLKMVKVRAGTINRMRELEVMKDELRSAGDQDTAIGESMQGLYARSQTEPYKPDPVVDGKVPKNNFGNIDLYVPSMLPRGAVHVPFKGVAKIAKKLGFDFAEAVTGFEFKKRRAFPVIEGVVIAQENEAALLEAYWEAEQDAEEKARTKREERVLKQWTRLIQGLLIRQRLQTQYAAKPDKESRSHVQDDSHNVAHDGEPGTSKDIVITMSHPSLGPGGGFLVGADDVVQPFHLPKTKFHQPIEEDPVVVKSPKLKDDIDMGTSEKPVGAHTPLNDFTTIPDTNMENLDDTSFMDSDADMALEDEEEINIADVPPLKTLVGIIPKSMQELAEDAALLQRGMEAVDVDVDDDIDIDVIYRTSSNNRAGNRDVTRIQPSASAPPAIDKSVPRPRPLRVKLKLSGSPGSSPGPATSESNTKVRRGGGGGGGGGGGSSSSRRPRKKSNSNSNSKKRSTTMMMDESDNDTEEDLLDSTPRKRARASEKREAPVVAPTRTLRPRASKTAAQLAAEEQERHIDQLLGASDPE